MLSKATKNLFQVFQGSITMVSRILIDVLEPYPDIAALKEYPTMVYHCILFLRMSDLPWENLLLP